MQILELIYRLFHWIYEEIWFRLYYGPVFHRLLNQTYPYYTDLTWSSKMKFLRLVRDHFEYFEFLPRQKMKLTIDRKAIICSGASQLVMGLPSESLTFFRKIIIYPDYYTSTHTQRIHKGEVNPGMRTIVFSWRGISETIRGDEQGRNLLMHEFGHALWLEHKLVGHEYTVLDESWVREFEILAEGEMTNIQGQESHFFRAYAFNNIEEFFAVAVENFFERPAKFKTQLPEMYSALLHILAQDPIRLRA